MIRLVIFLNFHLSYLAQYVNIDVKYKYSANGQDCELNLKPYREGNNNGETSIYWSLYNRK